MTDFNFKSKIHQIRFQLGLHPRPSWGNLQRSPDPLVGFGGRYAAGEGLGWGTGGKGEGKGRDGEVEGREREGPQVTVEPGPLRALLRHCETPKAVLSHRRSSWSDSCGTTRFR